MLPDFAAIFPRSISSGMMCKMFRLDTHLSGDEADDIVVVVGFDGDVVIVVIVVIVVGVVGVVGFVGVVDVVDVVVVLHLKFSNAFLSYFPKNFTYANNPLIKSNARSIIPPPGTSL